MKKSLLIFVLAALLLPLAASGQDEEFELTYGWKIWTNSHVIHDIHFMPGEDQILVLAGNRELGVFEYRETETGEIIKADSIGLSSFANYEFTPDSAHVLVANSYSGALALFNLEDLSLLKAYHSNIDSMGYWFTNIAVDPNKPYAYVTAYAERSVPDILIRGQVSVINYETMELVRHLTDFGPYAYECLAISPDGKYLATINDGRSYLKVWDLSNFELIVDYKLFDLQKSDSWCVPKDIVFSKTNTNHLFLCGDFTRHYGTGSAFHKFDISRNKEIEDYLVLGASDILLFDNEERALYLTSMYNMVINLFSKEVEYKYRKFAEKPGIWFDGIYSEKHDLFIGWASAYAQAGTYNRGVSVIGDEDHDSIIYPNPTNNIANISVDCFDPEMRYEIFDSAGHILFKTELINSESDQIEIDLSRYPTGTYFVKLYCGDTVKSYQIVKEG